ncbi:tetratricopeptide repeat protein [Flavobacterium sp.]|uniref:tetratricopeptide repeat-containing sensor histidine kinase n=1 Tax=Flavobacterium sp. TaxID=239 RepID=UPI0035298A31
MKNKFLFLVLLSCLGWSQQVKVDSLYRIVTTTKNDSIKVDVYNKIVWHYLFSDKVKTKQLIDSTEKIAIATHQKFGYNSLLGIKGIYYDINGKPDSAKYFFEKALQYAKNNNFLIHEKHTLNNLGMYNWNQGNFEQALRYYFESIKVNQQFPLEKQDRIDPNYNNIGLIYQEMGLFEKAITYHLKALKIRIDLKLVQEQIASYNNLGVCYKNMSQPEKAAQAFEKALALFTTIDKNNDYYIAIEGLASLAYDAGNYQKATNLYLQSLNRPSKIPINAKNKVTIYGNLAKNYIKLKKPELAIYYGELCTKELESNIENTDFEVEVYQPLAEANYMLNDIEKGAYYNTLFYEKIQEKFKQESAKALTEIEVKYKTAEKEKALAQEKAKVTEHELKIRTQNNWLLFLGFIILLTALVSLLFINRQYYKNKQLEKEKELAKVLQKIETQNRLTAQRLNISRDLHDNIGSQLTFIISSIDSLKMFLEENDTKVTQKLTSMSQFTRETIQELRDTIWAMNKDEISVEDLKTRISNFIEQANVSLQGIDFQFICNLPSEKVFNAKDGMNIYRIIQESVNNAIKHAKATTISVTIAKLVNQFEITIQDNGKGFDTLSVEKGNGLNSIHKRTAELNGTINISSSSKGTLVVLQF